MLNDNYLRDDAVFYFCKMCHAASHLYARQIPAGCERVSCVTTGVRNGAARKSRSALVRNDHDTGRTCRACTAATTPAVTAVT